MPQKNSQILIEGARMLPGDFELIYCPVLPVCLSLRVLGVRCAWYLTGVLVYVCPAPSPAKLLSELLACSQHSQL